MSAASAAPRAVTGYVVIARGADGSVQHWGPVRSHALASAAGEALQRRFAAGPDNGRAIEIQPISMVLLGGPFAAIERQGGKA